MSTPLEAAQTKQTARRNTKWQPARWSQLSAHVETKLTSHSSHACAAHCGVLIHRWPPCDLPARSLVPPPTAKQKQKARLGSSANTKWQPGQWSQFSAHVQTDLTSQSSHASAAHCGVLTRRRLFCDTPAPSLVPPSKTKGAPWLLIQHQMAAVPLVTIFGERQNKAHLAFFTRFRCSLWSPHPPAAAL